MPHAHHRVVTPTERETAGRAAGRLGWRPVTVETVVIPADDGTPLYADSYHPAEGPGPVVLTRTPYGRTNFAAQGVFFASHGYHCVIQDTRGPSSYFHEEEDGRAAASWISRQLWWDGRLGLFGFSYMGFTAYATAASAPEGLRALAVSAYSSDRVSAWYPGGSFGLDLALAWGAAQSHASDDRSGDGPSSDPIAALADTSAELTSPAFLTLPLSAADKAFSGVDIPFYQERLCYSGGDPHWAPLDFSRLLTSGSLPPTLLLDGWYDYHRPYMWADFMRLRASRSVDRIVAGPWGHMVDPVRGHHEMLAWFDRHLQSGSGGGAGDAPVELYVTPDAGWQELAEWPARNTRLQHWYLRADARLDPDTPIDDGQNLVDRYVYDPSDPTPAVGLASFAPADVMAETDNRPLERRHDVLVYTGPEMAAPLTLLGEVTADLWVTSSTPHTDFFARITDVQPNGRSLRIAEAVIRLAGDAPAAPDAPRHICLDLGTVAHRLRAGHRLRLQVSSGAHPFYARNLGTGEPLATGTCMVRAHQALHYDGVTYPSRITVRTETTRP